MPLPFGGQDAAFITAILKLCRLQESPFDGVWLGGGACPWETKAPLAVLDFYPRIGSEWSARNPVYPA